MLAASCADMQTPAALLKGEGHPLMPLGTCAGGEYIFKCEHAFMQSEAYLGMLDMTNYHPARPLYTPGLFS